MEDRQKTSIASLKKAVTRYCLRPLADFDKYKALDMVEQLANVSLQVKDKKADYYATVYSTLQERISKSAEQFKSYVLSLLGDREYEKVVESLAKVDKAFNQDATSSPEPSVVPQSPQGFLPPSFPGELPSPLSYPSPYLYACYTLCSLCCPLQQQQIPGFRKRQSCFSLFCLWWKRTFYAPLPF